MRWAAEIFSGRNVSPEAVGRPSNSFPYQDASPRSLLPLSPMAAADVFAGG